MKKLVLSVLLALTALPSFAQEDEYAKFQGVWWGETEDSIYHFIFVNDKLTTISKEDNVDMIVFGTYLVIDHTIKFTFQLGYASDTQEWENIEDSESDQVFQFIFSDQRLILVTNEDILIFTKIN